VINCWQPDVRVAEVGLPNALGTLYTVILPVYPQRVR